MYEDQVCVYGRIARTRRTPHQRLAVSVSSAASPARSALALPACWPPPPLRPPS